MRRGPTLIRNCLQIKAPADGSFAFLQHNTTPSLPGGSEAARRRHPQRLISPTGRKEVGLGRGEKDVGSCLGRAGMLGASQRAWQGVRGKVGVVPVLGAGTQKEARGALGSRKHSHRCTALEELQFLLQRCIPRDPGWLRRSRRPQNRSGDQGERAFFLPFLPETANLAQRYRALRRNAGTRLLFGY